MSWYVGEDGAQIWINRDSTVFTVVVSDQQLPLEQLTYLAVSSKKAVYQEAICEDDQAAGGRSKRNKDKNAGKQRGFIIRQEVEESPLTRVVPWFKDAAKKLMDCAVVSRVDADEAANVKKAKKKEREKANELSVPNLGANECRIETTSRIHHFAHGPGYRVEVSEGMVAQRLNMFTGRREISLKDWLSLLLNALESTGTHVMILKRSGKEVLGGAVNGEKKEEGDVKIQLRKDKAQQAENEWLESLLAGHHHQGEEEPIEPAEPTEPMALSGEPTAKAAPAADVSRWEALAPSARDAQAKVQEATPSPASSWEASALKKAAALRNRTWDQREQAELEASRQSDKAAWLPWPQQGYLSSAPQNWKEYPGQEYPTNGWYEAQPKAPERRWGKVRALCDACGRGGNLKLKLFWDETSGGRYCRTCWIDWYGDEPPQSLAA